MFVVTTRTVSGGKVFNKRARDDYAYEFEVDPAVYPVESLKERIITLIEEYEALAAEAEEKSEEKDDERKRFSPVQN